MMNPAIISSAIVAGVVGMLMGLMRKVASRRTSHDSRFPPVEVLGKKYRKLKILELFGFLFLVIIFTTIFSFAFYGFYQLVYRSTAEAAVWFLSPFFIIWILLGMFFGTVAAGSVMTILFYIFLKKEEWEEFSYYRNSTMPTPFTWVTTRCWLFGFIFLMTLVGAFFAFRNYASLTETRFSFRPLFGFSSHSFDYSQVAELKLTKRLETSSGRNRMNNNTIEVKFTDGTVWSSFNTPHNLRDDQLVDLLKFVSQKSGKTILGLY